MSFEPPKFELKRMYKKELAAFYGVTPETLVKWFKKAGISYEKHRTMLSKESIKKLIEHIGEP